MTSPLPGAARLLAAFLWLAAAALRAQTPGVADPGTADGLGNAAYPPQSGGSSHVAEPGAVPRLDDAAPLAELSGVFTDGKISLIANGAKVKVKGNLTLLNTGAKTAKKFNVTAYLAPSATFDPLVDTYLGSFKFVGAGNGKLKAGASFTLPFQAKGPSDQFTPSEYLLILIDSGEKISESDEANNVIAIGPLPAP